MGKCRYAKNRSKRSFPSDVDRAPTFEQRELESIASGPGINVGGGGGLFDAVVAAAAAVAAEEPGSGIFPARGLFGRKFVEVEEIPARHRHVLFKLNRGPEG